MTLRVLNEMFKKSLAEVYPTAVLKIRSQLCCVGHQNNLHCAKTRFPAVALQNLAQIFYLVFIKGSSRRNLTKRQVLGLHTASIF